MSTLGSKFVVAQYDKKTRIFEHLSEFLDKNDAFEYFVLNSTYVPKDKTFEVSQYKIVIKDKPSSDISHVLFTLPVTANSNKYFYSEGIEKMLL